MIKRDIEIDGRLVPFKASAAVPRMYRAYFQRDIFKDMLRVEESVKNKGDNDLPISDLEMFENIAFIMAKHADPAQPDTPDEWLDQFNTFSIYMVMPQLLKLWGANMQRDSEAKKKQNLQAVK